MNFQWSCSAEYIAAAISGFSAAALRQICFGQNKKIVLSSPKAGLDRLVQEPRQKMNATEETYERGFSLRLSSAPVRMIVQIPARCFSKCGTACFKALEATRSIP